MIIKKIKETLGQVFHSPEASGTWGDDITVNMDGGVGGSWKVECAVDDDPVECDRLQENLYTGIPAPAYLEDDPWFGPAPIRSQKQVDYMQQETEIKRKEREENFSVEPDDIHQKMYEIATKNQNTTLDLNPPGGSENFQEGPGGWQSGNGWSAIKK